VVRSLGDDEYEVDVGGAMAYVSGHSLQVQASSSQTADLAAEPPMQLQPSQVSLTSASTQSTPSSTPSSIHQAVQEVSRSVQPSSSSASNNQDEDEENEEDESSFEVLDAELPEELQEELQEEFQEPPRLVRTWSQLPGLPRWHTSRLRDLSFSPEIRFGDYVLRRFQQLAPPHLTNFPIADARALENFLRHSLYHRIDRHVRESDAESTRSPTLTWFGLEEGASQEVFLILVNSLMTVHLDPESCLLLVLVPDLRDRVEPSLSALLVHYVFPSADLANQIRMQYMVQQSARQLLAPARIFGAICTLEEDGCPRPPCCFEGTPLEDMTFDPTAHVNNTGVAAHTIQNEARAARIPVGFAYLSAADINQRIQWAIRRARISPHVAVPQYFTDRNSTQGGSINWLLPLSLAEPGSDDAHVALVLVPQRSQTGRRFYNAITVLPLQAAWLNALVINPFSGHWLRRA